MQPKIFQVQLRVYIDEMMRFFADDPKLGTYENPYKADAFCEVLSPYAPFYGPLKNILLFESNSVYRWQIVDSNGKELSFSSSDKKPEMDMQMISDKPSNEKWKKMFPDAPEMSHQGKIKLNSKKVDKNVFELQTSDDVSDGFKLKYSFLFEFTDAKGGVKYASIDPFGDHWPPPPPPGPGND